MSLLSFPPGLASAVSCCYSACQRTEEAPAVNELMNEQKPQCRVQADERLPRGWHSFPPCGLEYKQLFSCCISVLCLPHSLPLLLLRFSFMSIALPGHIFLPMQHIFGMLLSDSSSSLLFICNSLSPSFCFKNFLLFKEISIWVPLLAFLELSSLQFFPTTLSLLPPTLFMYKAICGTQDPEQQRKPKYCLLISFAYFPAWWLRFWVGGGTARHTPSWSWCVC